MSVSTIKGFINRTRAGVRYYSSVLKSDPRLLTQRKVFHAGIQRSGTNFLRSVLEQTIRVRVANAIDPVRNHPFHKHFRLQDQKTSIVMDPQYQNDLRFTDLDSYLSAADRRAARDAWPCIVIYKDPVNWLESIMRWGLKCGWIPNEDALLKTNLWSDWLAEYVAYYAKWMEFSEQSPEQVKLIQYEDLILSPKETLPDLAQFLGRSIKSTDTGFIQQVAQSRRRTLDELRADITKTPFGQKQVEDIYKLTPRIGHSKPLWRVSADK